MADRKITDLTALTTPASADVLPIVDVSEAAAADKNKKITVGELFKGVPDGTAAAPAIAFESDDGNGIFLSTTDTVGIATNGSSRMTVSTTAVTSTLPVIVPDGTAAAPSVAFTGSGTDTGVYSPGVDQVAISTGGSQRLLIQSTGLTVNGTTTLNGTTLSLGAEGGANGFINAPETLYFNIDSNSNETGKAFIFAHNATDNTGTELFRIQDDGKVGLGTSSPTDVLHVVGDGGASDNSATSLAESASKAKIRFQNRSESSLSNFQGTVNSGDTWYSQIANGGGTASYNQVLNPYGGNVGIGTTSPGRLLTLNGGANSVIKYETTGSNKYCETYYDGSSYYIDARNDAANGQIVFRGLGGGTSQEYGRFDTSGRLLVGTSSSTVINGDAYKAQIVASDASAGLGITRTSNNNASPYLSLVKSRSGGIVSDGDTLGLFQFIGHDGTDFNTCSAAISAYVDGTPGANDMPGRLVFSTTADGASSPTERMRIRADGRVDIGATPSPEACRLFSSSTTTTQGPALVLQNTDSGSTSYNIVVFYRESTTVGTISTTNTATAYNTSSDYRLKENIVPLTGAADRVNQLQVHRFNFIADPDKTVDGFIAHEAQAVVPECVTGEKDAVDDNGNPIYQGIDQSKLVPLLTAALQEALAEIESLKARVTALEP